MCRFTCLASVVLLSAVPLLWARGGGGGGHSGGGAKTVQVSSHVRKDGTTVQAHARSAPRTTARMDARTSAPIMVASPESMPDTPEPAPATPVPATTTRPTVQPKATPTPQELAERAEQDAARKLALARKLADTLDTSRLSERGKVNTRLTEIVRDYPTTKAAAEARVILGRR